MSADRPLAAELDCRACGACCMDASDGRVLVSAADLTRWQRDGARTLLEHVTDGHFGQRALASTATGHCVFLGAPSGAHDCTVYDARPETCRSLERGGPQCLEYRRDRGMAP